jgi:plastocyanin
VSTATFPLAMKRGNVFAPATMTVPFGATVKVTNQDLGVTHNWTDPGLFSSGNLGFGGTYSFRFTYTGTYQFECTIHAGMTGSITVS